jgi:hypothetical protein
VKKFQELRDKMSPQTREPQGFTCTLPGVTGRRKIGSMKMKPMTQTAQEIPNVIEILDSAYIDGVGIISTPCRDYDDFSSLPRAVKFKGVPYGRSGWNSDLGCAYFRTDKSVVDE